MNWKRGLFRLWLVGSLVWIGVATYLYFDDFTAMSRVGHMSTPAIEYTCNPSPCPIFENKYDCLLYGLRDRQRSCNYRDLRTFAPDWGARGLAVRALLAPPIAVPILGFVLFWAGWLAVRIGKWIVQGFGPLPPENDGPAVKHQSETGMPHPSPSFWAGRLRAVAIFVFAPMLLGLVVATVVWLWQALSR